MGRKLVLINISSLFISIYLFICILFSTDHLKLKQQEQ